MDICMEFYSSDLIPFINYTIRLLYVPEISSMKLLNVCNRLSCNRYMIKINIEDCYDSIGAFSGFILYSNNMNVSIDQVNIILF